MCHQYNVKLLFNQYPTSFTRKKWFSFFDKIARIRKDVAVLLILVMGNGNASKPMALASTNSLNRKSLNISHYLIKNLRTIKNILRNYEPNQRSGCVNCARSLFWLTDKTFCGYEVLKIYWLVKTFRCWCGIIGVLIFPRHLIMKEHK